MVARDDGIELRLVDRKVEINGSPVDTSYPVLEAVIADGLVVVLLDPDADKRRWGTFPNLVAFDGAGRKVWTASTPTTTTGDCYYRISSTEPLIAYSIASFECEIDLRTGRIVRQTFTK